MKEKYKILLKMKDTSELMVDLAYSALLFNNKVLAKEVYALENYTDVLYKRIIRYAMDSCSESDLEMALILIRLATSIETIADCAKEIADVVLRDIEPHPILKKSIGESNTAIFRDVVSGRSILVDNSIGSAGVAQEMGVWIVAIRRGKKWIFGPNEKTVIRKGDILIGKGPAGSRKRFHLLSKGDLREL